MSRGRALGRDGVSVGNSADGCVRAIQLGAERSMRGRAGSIHAFGGIYFGVVLDLDRLRGALWGGSGTVLGLREVDLPAASGGVIGSARRRDRGSDEQGQNS